jgi:hypothetical protein
MNLPEVIHRCKLGHRAESWNFTRVGGSELSRHDGTPDHVTEGMGGPERM